MRRMQAEARASFEAAASERAQKHKPGAAVAATPSTVESPAAIDWWAGEYRKAGEALIAADRQTSDSAPAATAAQAPSRALIDWWVGRPWEAREKRRSE